MPDYGLDASRDRLGDAADELDVALAELAYARDTATHWRDELTYGGMLGIAGGCEKIRAATETIHERAAGMRAAIRAQHAVLGSVSDTTTPDRVVAILGPIDHALNALRATGSAAIESTGHMAELVRRYLRGGKPEDLLTMAATTRRAMERSREHLQAAVDGIKETIRRARETGHDADAAPLVPRPVDNGAHTGMPEPVPEDRSGARIFNASEEGEGASPTEAFRRRVTKKSDDVADTVTYVAGRVEDGLWVRPTGQHLGNSAPTTAPRQQSAIPDTVTGVVAAIVILCEIGRAIMRRFREKR